MHTYKTIDGVSLAQQDLNIEHLSLIKSVDRLGTTYDQTQIDGIYFTLLEVSQELYF